MFAAKIYYIKRNFKTIMSLTVIQHFFNFVRLTNGTTFNSNFPVFGFTYGFLASLKTYCLSLL